MMLRLRLQGQYRYVLGVSFTRWSPICVSRRIALVVLASLWPIEFSTLRAQETPKDIIAAHIRIQGYPCDVARGARRDISASRPDEAVWHLKCSNASYKVRLIPDLAAIVERID